MESSANQICSNHDLGHLLGSQRLPNVVTMVMGDLFFKGISFEVSSKVKNVIYRAIIDLHKTLWNELYLAIRSLVIVIPAVL